MLSIPHYIREFLLRALKRYSPGRLLQYLLSLCRVVFSKCKSKCSGPDSSHEFLPKTLTPVEGNGYLSEGSMITPVGHIISGSRTPAQVEAGTAPVGEDPAQHVNTSPPCVCDQFLRIVYANYHHVAQIMIVLPNAQVR